MIAIYMSIYKSICLTKMDRCDNITTKWKGGIKWVVVLFLWVLQAIRLIYYWVL